MSSPTQYTPTTRHVDSATDARRRRVCFVSVLCGNVARAWLFHPRNAPDSFPRWVGSSQSAYESRTRLRESSGRPLAPVAELHTHHLKRCGKDPPPNCRPWRRWTKAAAAYSRPRPSNSARGIARSSRCVHEYPRRAPPGCPRAHVVGGSLSWALRRRPCSRLWSRRRAHGRKSGRRSRRTSRRSALRRPLTRRGYRSCLGASSATNILR